MRPSLLLRASQARNSALWMIALAFVAPVQATAQEPVQVPAGVQPFSLPPKEAFEAAARADAAGDHAAALVLYDELAASRNVAIRSEARFRKAKLLARIGRPADAALALRTILDEQPEAQPARIELAAILAQLGDIGGARRSLRQAQAGSLPPDVAQMVQRFAAALRSQKPWGGSFELALAPDSNINRATSATTLDTVIAPLTLSEDAQQQSGLGLRQTSQIYARIDLGDRLTLVPRASSQGTFYRASQFNDLTASALLGAEWRLKADRITTSIGHTWRWFGGRVFARSEVVTFDWLHPLSRRAQSNLSGSISRVRHPANALQDGIIYAAATSIERALTSRSGLSVSLSINRQSSRDPGYATTSGGIGASYWYEWGRTTLFGSVSASRLEGDARLALFLARRADWYWRAGAGAVWRKIEVAGFSPILRVTYERNQSTVGLYDFRRLTSDVGMTRSF